MPGFGFDVFYAFVEARGFNRQARDRFTLRQWHNRMVGNAPGNFLFDVGIAFPGAAAAITAARTRCTQSLNDHCRTYDSMPSFQMAGTSIADEDPTAPNTNALRAQDVIKKYLTVANVCARDVQAAVFPAIQRTRTNQGGYAGAGVSCEGFAVLANGNAYQLHAQTVKNAPNQAHAEEQWFGANNYNQQGPLTNRLQTIRQANANSALARIEMNITIPVCGNPGNQCEQLLRAMRASLTAAGYGAAPLLIYTERGDDAIPLSQRVYEVQANAIVGHGYWL